MIPRFTHDLLKDRLHSDHLAWHEEMLHGYHYLQHIESDWGLRVLLSGCLKMGHKLATFWLLVQCFNLNLSGHNWSILSWKTKTKHKPWLTRNGYMSDGRTIPRMHCEALHIQENSYTLNIKEHSLRACFVAWTSNVLITGFKKKKRRTAMSDGRFPRSHSKARRTTLKMMFRHGVTC